MMMTKMARPLIGIAVLSLCSLRMAVADDYEMVELSDSSPAAQLPHEVQAFKESDPKRAEIRAARDSQSRRHLAKLRRITEEMSESGCASVGLRDVSIYDELIADVRHFYSSSSDSQRLENARPKGENPAFPPSSVLGSKVLYQDADGSHYVSTVYEFDDLGVVLVEVLDYQDIRGAKVRVNKPTGNLYIHGLPATYTAMIGPDGIKGLSSITYITEASHISVTAMKCITKSDQKEFGRFVALAQAAYN